MGSIQEAVGLIAEVLTWIGLIAGATVLILRLIVRGLEGEWLSTDAIVVHDESGSRVRWLAHDGGLHDHSLSASEAESLGDLDHLTAHYARRLPQRVHFAVRGEKFDRDGRGLWILGLILLGVGALSFLVSFGVMFLPN